MFTSESVLVKHSYGASKIVIKATVEKEGVSMQI
jgi:hypothetical protein